MTWGDPIELFDDDETLSRAERLKHHGITAGALCKYGSPSIGMFLWSRPEASALITEPVQSLVLGLVLFIDVITDPSADWVLVQLNSNGNIVIGWIPAELVSLID